MGVGEDWSEAARKRDRAYQEDGRSRGSYVADQDDATSERAHLEKVWAQASASGVRYSRGTNKMTSAVVAQSYSPPSLLLANTLTFHCSTTSKSGGAGKGNKNQEHQLAPSRAFSTVRKVEREIKITSNLMGRKIKDERLISETFITTRVFDSASLICTGW